MLDDDLARNAYHECGHALMAEMLGGRTELLTIDPDGGDDLPERSGEFTVRWPDGCMTAAQIALNEIKVALAGPVAEMIFDGDQYAPEFLEAWRMDWEMAVERAEAHLPPNRPVHEHLAHVLFELRSFFERDDVWSTLAALADALEAHETLEREEIDEVLESWPIEA